MPKRYWLMKSEPTTFSIDDLKKRLKKTEPWDGVRNYQARNFMRDLMQKGDEAFFYHSNCDTPGIVGIVTISKTAYPDPSAFDKHSPYYDPKSSPDNPRWMMVDVTFKKAFKETLPLTLLKTIPKLKNMALVRPGNRLSVMPVTPAEWQIILNLEEE